MLFWCYNCIPLMVLTCIIGKTISSSSSLAQQPLSVNACLYPLVKWAWLSLIYCYHSRIVSPTYGGTVYSGLEPMTGMLLSRTSWRLYHQTGSSSKFDLIRYIKSMILYVLIAYHTEHHCEGNSIITLMSLKLNRSSSILLISKIKSSHFYVQMD